MVTPYKITIDLLPPSAHRYIAITSPDSRGDTPNGWHDEGSNLPRGMNDINDRLEENASR